ncbi:hypothetical protein BDZ89DRAFT_1036164 [Hymenopellis radicata]|nr:hypothetical protein BDZ89DRAFT_1036164 [Hymenopellis radicata]
MRRTDTHYDSSARSRRPAWPPPEHAHATHDTSPSSPGLGGLLGSGLTLRSWLCRRPRSMRRAGCSGGSIGSGGLTVMGDVGKARRATCAVEWRSMVSGRAAAASADCSSSRTSVPRGAGAGLILDLAVMQESDAASPGAGGSAAASSLDRVYEEERDCVGVVVKREAFP